MAPVIRCRRSTGIALRRSAAARFDAGQALAFQHGGEAADGGFDFGKFRHVFRQLGCVCPRHKPRLEPAP